jgi:hypothetical protein
MDFLGTVTPADLLASVTSGVQYTGVALWPLFVFVGVPVAFVIAGYVLSFIKRSFGNRK